MPGFLVLNIINFCLSFFSNMENNPLITIYVVYATDFKSITYMTLFKEERKRKK